MALDRREFLGFAGSAAGALASGPSGALARQTGVPASPLPASAGASILETRVICRQPGKYLGDGTQYHVGAGFHPVIKARVIERDRYIGWPTITRTRNGDLIVVFSGDRDAHVCPWGKTQMVRSADGGKTWSEPETINNTPLDDRDAGILETGQGTLLLSWFTSVAFASPNYKTAYERYARIAEKIALPEIRKHYLGSWVRRSEDGGRSWGDAARTRVSAPHGPVSLRDGRLLYIGTAQLGDEKGIFVEESADDGRTWKTLARLTPGEEAGRLSEPHMVELASGKLIAMVRNQPEDRTRQYLLQSESRDGGKAWSPLRSTGIWGLPPHLLQLANGWVMLSYGHRREPFSQRVCISKDDGDTWGDPITIATSIGSDMGYPSSVQLEDGSILTAYYQALEPGEPTVLMTTHWKLDQ